jgi:hypothetical protein
MYGLINVPKLYIYIYNHQVGQQTKTQTIRHDQTPILNSILIAMQSTSSL